MVLKAETNQNNDKNNDTNNNNARMNGGIP